MKKRIFFGLAIAALASAGFASAYKSSRPSLTPAQLENLEALSHKEAWVEFEYDVCCESTGNDYCLLNGSVAIPNSTPVPCK